MYIQMYMIDTCISFICIYTCIYIYVCAPPTRTYLLLYFIDCFIARSTICYLPSAKKKHKYKQKNKNGGRNRGLQISTRLFLVYLGNQPISIYQRILLTPWNEWIHRKLWITFSKRKENRDAGYVNLRLFSRACELTIKMLIFVINAYTLAGTELAVPIRHWWC